MQTDASTETSTQIDTQISTQSITQSSTQASTQSSGSPQSSVRTQPSTQTEYNNNNNNSNVASYITHIAHELMRKEVWQKHLEETQTKFQEEIIAIYTDQLHIDTLTLWHSHNRTPKSATRQRYKSGRTEEQFRQEDLQHVGESIQLLQSQRKDIESSLKKTLETHRREVQEQINQYLSSYAEVSGAHRDYLQVARTGVEEHSVQGIIGEHMDQLLKNLMSIYHDQKSNYATKSGKMRLRVMNHITREIERETGVNNKNDIEGRKKEKEEKEENGTPPKSSNKPTRKDPRNPRNARNATNARNERDPRNPRNQRNQGKDSKPKPRPNDARSKRAQSGKVMKPQRPNQRPKNTAGNVANETNKLVVNTINLTILCLYE